ncbi:MAG: VCBS repeat-containing protein [Gammaproteobacteria bacterium]|jgi:hypothetical protein|nr:VCBS repeat-containing protein [Gammaproteobacteria bacterium]
MQAIGISTTSNSDRDQYALVMRLLLMLAVALTVVSCRWTLPPNDNAGPADFNVTTIDTQEGTAFIAVGELAGNKRHQEILNTVFKFKPDPAFGSIPDGGEVTLYQWKRGVWVGTTVVSADENVRNPNRPTIADVDGDGRNDFIQPAGWFLNSALDDNTGSITWWRNNGNGTFSRNDVILEAGGAYEGVVFVDLDKDGIKDIVSTFQDFGNPFVFPATPPTVFTHFFKGIAPGQFTGPITLCECGGPLPVVFDVNGDRKLDIVTAQYLGVATIANPEAGLSDESFIWLENTASRREPLSTETFTKHVIARGLGESVQILPVDNIDGDLMYGGIGVNQVNQTVDPAAAPPQVVRLTPGRDIRAEWNVEVLKDDFTVESTSFGSTSPGPAAEGDLDGDGDIDIVVPGSADKSIYWLERKGDGSWFSRDIALEYDTAGRDWGLAGVAVADLDYDGRNEIVFSAFFESSINVVERVPGTGGNYPALPRVPDKRLPY